MTSKKYMCPICQSDDIVDVAYLNQIGETFKSLHNKKIKFVESILRPDNPVHKCVKCGHQW